MSDARDLSWIPGWVPRHSLEQVHGSIGDGASASPVSFLRPRAGEWGAFHREMDGARRALSSMPLREIVEAIDVVASRWTDRAWPLRAATCELIVEATGFSAEATARSLDVELRNYRAASLWSTLRRELGDPRVLDELRPSPFLGGLTRAFGPRSILAVLTGNVPGLPALAMVRALLVKAPIVVKVASGEPAFASAFARSLHDADPRLGAAVVITYWTRDDVATLREAVSPFDTVMVYGGEEVCETVRTLVSSKQRYVEHGHKVSVGILSRKYVERAGLPRVASDVARDMSMFNQQACIAPQAYLVEGGRAAVARLGEALATACGAYASECPLGVLDARDAAAQQLRRADLAWRAAAEGNRAWFGPSLDWSLVVANDFGADAATGNRVLRLIPVDDLEDAIKRLEPLSAYLQNVGLGATRDELPRAAEALGALGVSRVSQPGRMADPSMMWRHDGRACVAELVRWSDVEMHEEIEFQQGGSQ